MAQHSAQCHADQCFIFLASEIALRSKYHAHMISESFSARRRTISHACQLAAGSRQHSPASRKNLRIWLWLMISKLSAADAGAGGYSASRLHFRPDRSALNAERLQGRSRHMECGPGYALMLFLLLFGVQVELRCARRACCRASEAKSCSEMDCAR